MVGGGGREPPEPKQHVCVLCNRNFPSGRSLGGHTRAHFMTNRRGKKTQGLSGVEKKIQEEVQEVALVLMMMSRKGTAAVEDTSSKNSAVVEEHDPLQEEWVVLKRRRRSRPGSDPTEDFLHGGEWEEAAELGRRTRSGSGSGDWHVESRKKKQNLKKDTFQCNSCQKVFASYQALGGHRAAQKRTNGPCYVAAADGAEKETAVAGPLDEGDGEDDDEESGARIAGRDPPAREAAFPPYQCPTCLKVFGSGQALGGHKRSHVAVRTVEADGPLDLNSPAPADENSGVTNEHWPAGTKSTSTL